MTTVAVLGQGREEAVELLGGCFEGRQRHKGLGGAAAHHEDLGVKEGADGRREVGGAAPGKKKVGPRFFEAGGGKASRNRSSSISSSPKQNGMEIAKEQWEQKINLCHQIGKFLT